MLQTLGAEIHNSKPYQERAKTTYHLSNAALDLTSLVNDADVYTSTQIWVEVHGKRTLLATLSDQTPQARLDHAFESGEQATYYTHGPGIIHLSGYFIPTDICNEQELIEEKEEEEREEEVRKNKAS